MKRNVMAHSLCGCSNIIGLSDLMNLLIEIVNRIHNLVALEGEIDGYDVIYFSNNDSSSDNVQDMIADFIEKVVKQNLFMYPSGGVNVVVGCLLPVFMNKTQLTNCNDTVHAKNSVAAISINWSVNPVGKFK